MRSFKELRKSFLSEGYSKNLTDKDVDKQFKSFGSEKSQIEFFGDLDKAREDMKKEYSPKNSARPNSWTALSYPVKDKEYYFAFISNNEKKNVKANDELNMVLKNALKEINRSGKAIRAVEAREVLWGKASEWVKKAPRDLGAGDTMTRDEIWTSIGHMLGMNEDVQERRDAMKTRAGIKIGRREKAPKYEAKGITEAVKTLGPKWQKDGKVFPINPNAWKKEWKNKYKVEFIRVVKKKTLPNRPEQTFVFVKGEEKDLANWFMQVYAKQPGLSVPLLKSASKTLDMVKDADDGHNFGFSIESKESSNIKEGKLADEMIRRHFPNVWAMSAKEPKVLDMFHKSVDTANFNAKKKAYGKMKIGQFIRDELNGGYLDREIIKKLNLKASNDLSALRGKLNDVKEANFEFVDMDKKTRDIVVNLAKKHGVKVKERKKGNLSNLDLEGPNNKMGKFMENLPPEALE